MGKPAIFLDRDGVLVEERSYITDKGELKIFPYTAECIRGFKGLGYHAICISNQSAVGRGMMSLDDLRDINQYLIEETNLDAVYCCPHYWKDNVPICGCRKPGKGLFLQAMEEFDVDLPGSYMVGDRAADILAGQSMGIKTVLLESGYGTMGLEQEVEPDFVMEDLCEFLRYLECMLYKNRSEQQ